jgi:hypothetical protein
MFVRLLKERNAYQLCWQVSQASFWRKDLKALPVTVRLHRHHRPVLELPLRQVVWRLDGLLIGGAEPTLVKGLTEAGRSRRRGERIFKRS